MESLVLQIKIAFKNIFRNHRRTLLSLVMIAGGFAAIVLFRGFSARMLSQLRDVAINSQYGHLQVASSSYWEKSTENQRDTLLTHDSQMIDWLKKQPEVTYASGRLNYYILLSYGERSTSAQVLSFDVAAEKSKIEHFKILEGATLSGDSPYETILGHTLAKKLNAKPGHILNVIAFTYDGVINALELTVKGTFKTNLAELDDVTLIVPLSSSLKLLDTQHVEKIVVGLNSTEITHSTADRFNTALKSIEPKAEVKEWSELAKLYQEVVAFYNIYDGVIGAIIVSLVFLGILNTLGMAVFERTGEIGTIRALGYKQRQVLQTFVLEGGLLGILGCLGGSLLAVILASILNRIKIAIVMPGASAKIFAEFELIWPSYRDALLLCLIASLLAAAIPAYRAARVPIVDALKHNI